MIPYTDRCVVGGGERKPPLIMHYQSIKSTAQNMGMAFDMEGLDRMAEIAPDGKKWNRQGIKPRYKGIWNMFDCHDGGRMHPRCN